MSRRVGVAVVIAVSVPFLGSCSGAEAPSDPQESVEQSTAAVTDVAPPTGMEALEQAVLKDEPWQPPKAIASAEGVIGHEKHPSDVVFDVYKVVARENSTFISWSVRGQDGGKSDSYFSSEICSNQTQPHRNDPFAVYDGPRHSASLVTLVEKEGERVLWPLQRPISENGLKKNLMGCLCSGPPRELTSEPFVMTGLYPAVSEGTETVDLSIPTFGTIEDVPVTRQ